MNEIPMLFLFHFSFCFSSVSPSLPNSVVF